MKTTVMATVLLLLPVSVQAQDTQTFRNANGQVTGRAITNNVGTQFYNAQGQNTGRATTNSTGTTFYNAQGQVTGRTSGGRK